MTPRAYRRLLSAHPRRWREQHGEVLLGMLLTADEAEGRDAPRLRLRLRLLLQGALLHLRRRPRRTGPSLALLVDDPALFDQTNGVVAPATDDVDRRGLRLDRHHGHGGIDRLGRPAERYRMVER